MLANHFSGLCHTVDEIELKLAVSPTQMPKLRRNALLRSVAQSRARTFRLENTYYDTASLDLKNAGMSLRVRKSGRECVQTFKAPSGARNGLHQRQEVETPVEGETPDIKRLGNCKLARLLAKKGRAGGLLPVFKTEFERRRIPVRIADSEIELVLEEETVNSNGRSEAICEAELELKSGSPARLYELALALNDKIPFRVEARTKAVRGYDLFAGAAPVGLKATPVLLKPKMTSAEVMHRLGRSFVDQLRANEAAVFAGTDPEGVHQMRIAVRRLRASLGIFSLLIDTEFQAFLKTELQWLQRVLGPARDLDVFILETLSPLQAQFDGERGLELLAVVADHARKEAYATTLRVLGQRRYTRLLLRLDLWLDGGGLAPTDEHPRKDALQRPVIKFARNTLKRRARKLLCLGDKYDGLKTEELHAVRLEAKKLRYASEFMMSLYPKKLARKYISRVAAIQDTLGTLNDSVMGAGLVANLVRRGRKAGLDGEKLAQAHGLITVWRRARLEADLANFHDVWRSFAAAEPFWKK